MRTVRNALRAVEVVAARQPIGLADVAAAAGLPLTTAHRTVATLVEEGWLTGCADGTKRYVVADRIVRVLAGRDHPLRLVAAPVCAELRDRSGESVMLSVPEADHVVVVGQWEGTGELRVVHAEGVRAPMAGAATGKAYLALAAPNVRARILAAAPQAKTRVRIDPGELGHEIEMVRHRGWAVVDGEWLDGIAQVGAAIVVNDEPIGGVGIGLPAHRFNPEVSGRLGRLVSAAAQEIAERVRAEREAAYR